MKMIDLFSKATGYMSVLAIFASMVIIIYEVFARYIFRWATVWEIEASVYLIIFTTFVGSAFALKNNAHIKMDVLEERISPRAKRRVALGTSVFSFAFCVVTSFKGWQMWWEAFRLGWRSDSVWAPPLAIPYLFLPIGFSLMSLQHIALIAKHIERLRSGDQ